MRQMFKHISKYLHPMLLIGMCLVLSGCGGHLDAAPFWSNSMRDCWPCAIYGSIFQALNNTVTGAVPVLCSFAQVFLYIGLLFFITMKIGAAALNPDLTYKKTMQTLAYTMLKAIAVSALLYTADTFYGVIGSQVIEPIGNMFLEIGSTLLNSAPPTATGLSLRAFEYDAATNANTLWNGWENVTVEQNVFGNLPYQIQVLVFRIYRALRAGVAVGIYIINRVDDYDVIGVVAGLFILIFGLELTLVVPTIFIDSFLNLALAFLLLPLLLVSWVFEGSSKALPALKNVMPYLTTAFLDIVFGCLFISVMATTLQTYADSTLNNAWSNGVSGRDLSFVTEARYLNLGFLILIVLIVGFRKMAEQIGQISKLYGGGGATTGWGFFGMLKDVGKGLGASALGLVTANIALVASGAFKAARTFVKKR